MLITSICIQTLLLCNQKNNSNFIMRSFLIFIIYQSFPTYSYSPDDFFPVQGFQQLVLFWGEAQFFFYHCLLAPFWKSLALLTSKSFFVRVLAGCSTSGLRKSCVSICWQPSSQEKMAEPINVKTKTKMKYQDQTNCCWTKSNNWWPF